MEGSGFEDVTIQLPTDSSYRYALVSPKGELRFIVPSTPDEISNRSSNLLAICTISLIKLSSICMVSISITSYD